MMLKNYLKSLLIFVFLIFCAVSKAQAPQGINYQGVARNAQGKPFPSQAINL